MTNHSSFLRFIRSTVSCLLLLPCFAQEPANISLQFLSFPKSTEPLLIQLLIGQGKTVELKVPCNELTQPIQVARQASWAFGETLIGTDDKPYFKIHGQATALAAPSQFILLVRKGNLLADGIDVIPIANDVNSLGGGKFLFMNAAKVDIAGEVGGSKFVIKPGMHNIINPKPDESGTMFHTVFYYRDGDNPRAFFSSTWPYVNKGRSMVFFYSDPNTKQMNFHTIRDFSL